MPYKNKEDEKEYKKKYMKEYYIKNRGKMKEYQRQWCTENKENKKEYQKQWHTKNKEKRNKESKQWRTENKEYNKQYYIENKEKIKELMKQYYIGNKEKIFERARLQDKKRKKTDKKYNINCRMRILTWWSLRGNKKNRSWKTLIDYTLTDLIKRLNKTMPEGYNWQDYLKGKLHIDHIIPIRAFIFKNPEDNEFKQCWSLYNLRLLPAKENIIKSDNITNPILLGLLLNLNQKEVKKI